MKRDWYRMHDSDNRGAFIIDAADQIGDAQRWNRQGYGIFWTVNAFNGPRKIDHLERVNAWAVDMDIGTKDEMCARLRHSPLVPSVIIETNRGYQAYWNAKDGTAKNWNAIVLERLVPYFGADKNARDLARILRVPGFLHLKDPTRPFMVRVVHELDVAYTEQQVAISFPARVNPVVHRESLVRLKREATWNGSDDFWDQVYSLDCEEGLLRLSGHSAVSGEQYTFKRVANGNLNILVDGKGSSCWVDGNKRIGSCDNGGPTLAQWLRWFGNSYADAARVLKQIFPGLDRKRAA